MISPNFGQSSIAWCCSGKVLHLAPAWPFSWSNLLIGNLEEASPCTQFSLFCEIASMHAESLVSHPTIPTRAIPCTNCNVVCTNLHGRPWSEWIHFRNESISSNSICRGQSKRFGRARTGCAYGLLVDVWISATPALTSGRAERRIVAMERVEVRSALIGFEDVAMEDLEPHTSKHPDSSRREDDEDLQPLTLQEEPLQVCDGSWYDGGPQGPCTRPWIAYLFMHR